MLPIAIIAIILNISVYYNLVNRIEQGNPKVQRTYENSSSLSNPTQQENSGFVYLNTNIGITPLPFLSFRELIPYNVNRTTHSNNREDIEKPRAPIVTWQFLPYPLIGGTNDKGIFWSLSIPFRLIEYSPLILLIFTLCPLSIVVAFQMQTSNMDQPTEISPLTVRSVWKHTSSRALKVIIVPILFLVIAELSRYIYWLITLLFPSLPVSYAGTPLILLQMFVNIYFLVTLSLYNQCTIFENRSIMDIFKRSHSLVRGSRLKYLSIYLLTAWVVAIVSSVLMGSALFVLSVFFTELAPIRDALTPLRFLSLFIGGNVGVILQGKLGILPSVSILIVKGIVSMLLVPLWAIVTTHLYNERISMTPEAIEA